MIPTTIQQIWELQALSAEFSVLGTPVPAQPNMLRDMDRVGQCGEELGLFSMNYPAFWFRCHWLWFCEGPYSRKKQCVGQRTWV